MVREHLALTAGTSCSVSAAFLAYADKRKLREHVEVRLYLAP